MMAYTYVHARPGVVAESKEVSINHTGYIYKNLGPIFQTYLLQLSLFNWFGYSFFYGHFFKSFAHTGRT